jgi:NADPH-dependent ferric siderophore reductase
VNEAKRIRREPPAFRQVTVRRSESLTRFMTRVTLWGADLEGFVVDKPAASVRVLLPSPGESEIVMPEWNGNEFLLPDGSRPAIRTFTPRRVDPEALELDVDIVLHDGGVASDWARTATAGDAAAVSGPGRGYDVDTTATGFLLGGDETAIPAISQLLEVLPDDKPVRVLIELSHPDARPVLPEHSGASVSWLESVGGEPPGDALKAAIQTSDIDAGTKVWVAGEAAAVQRIRRHLFEERDVPRARASIRGYWKVGRTA